MFIYPLFIFNLLIIRPCIYNLVIPIRNCCIDVVFAGYVFILYEL